MVSLGKSSKLTQGGVSSREMQTGAAGRPLRVSSDGRVLASGASEGHPCGARALEVLLILASRANGQGPRATTERGVNIGCRGHPWPWRRQRSIKKGKHGVPTARGRARQRRAALILGAGVTPAAHLSFSMSALAEADPPAPQIPLASPLNFLIALCSSVGSAGTAQAPFRNISGEISNSPHTCLFCPALQMAARFSPLVRGCRMQLPRDVHAVAAERGIGSQGEFVRHGIEDLGSIESISASIFAAGD